MKRVGSNEKLITGKNSILICPISTNSSNLPAYKFALIRVIRFNSC